MTRSFALISLFISCFSCSQAANVDTVTIYSQAMKKNSKCVVISPASSLSNKGPWPVVYLLHGWSGNYSNWITKVPELKSYADQYQLMIVCPDGAYSSWYFDSPVDSTMRYETYIGKEVPAFIDSHYPTIPSRAARAITGLSMGGHGGLFLGFRHADVFGGSGSMSGGVDINTFRTSYEINKLLGDTINHVDNWNESSVMNVVDHYPKDSLAIIFDCGTEDFFYAINHKLHEKMVRLKIPHDYIERPGKHDWFYWANAVRYQLLFFRTYFDKQKKMMSGN